MGVFISVLIYICMWIATALCWAVYYIGVGIFYLIGAVVTVIRDAISERKSKPKPPSKREIAREASLIVEDMYTAANNATDRVRAFGSHF